MKTNLGMPWILMYKRLQVVNTPEVAMGAGVWRRGMYKDRGAAHEARN